MEGSIMNFKKVFNTAKLTVAKHSPAILTTVGIVGLGATAYLAYKSRNKVEAVIEQVEADAEAGIEIDKVEVGKGMIEALWLPISVGVASTACVLLAQKIQMGRIKTLAGALAVQQAQNIYFENKYKEEHGEEAYQKFVTPTKKEVIETKDAKGKTKKTTVDVRQELDKTVGQWYDESQEYAADDHSYNMSYIESVEERLQGILFQRGSLMLNEVREALGFERIRNGALLGWTSADNFEISKTVTNVTDEDGEIKTQIWVYWAKPRYIYDEVEFNGRYSIY